MELDTNRAFQMTTIDNNFVITGRTEFCFDILILMENAHLSMPLNTAEYMFHHCRLCCAMLPMDIFKNTCRNNFIKCCFSFTIFICK